MRHRYTPVQTHNYIFTTFYIEFDKMQGDFQFCCAFIHFFGETDVKIRDICSNLTIKKEPYVSPK